MTPEVARNISNENLFDYINCNIETGGFLNELIKLYYHNSHGQLWLGDSLIWLNSIPENTIDMVFADPPYNIKKAQWDMFQSSHAYIQWCMEWIAQVHRILKPTGTFIYVDFQKSSLNWLHRVWSTSKV